jgi:hypothetical protein
MTHFHVSSSALHNELEYFYILIEINTWERELVNSGPAWSRAAAPCLVDYGFCGAREGARIPMDRSTEL